MDYINLSTRNKISLTSSQIAASDYMIQELVNQRCHIFRVVEMKVVTSINIMMFTLLHEVHSLKVYFLSLAPI
jgi:hypothetical protein